MSNTVMKINNSSIDKTSAESHRSSFKLWLTSDRQLELIKTHFHCELLPNTVVAVRGKTAGAFSTEATFQWTSAVQALTILMIKAAMRHELKDDSCENSIAPLLEGLSGSLASSLDASIYKQTAWLDLFGTTPHGDSLSRRILTRSNPGRRRSGPVMISLNQRLIPTSCIEVYLDDHRVRDPFQLAQFIEKIEQTWIVAREQNSLNKQVSFCAAISKTNGSIPSSGDALNATIQGRVLK